MDENNSSSPNKLIETMRREKDEEISTLRPQALNDFIGQSGLKDKLTIFMTASISVASRLTIRSFTALPDWARPPSRGSSQKR